MQIEAIVRDKICSGISPEFVNVVRYEHMRWLDFAERWGKISEEANVEIVIGLDQYWPIIGSEVREGTSGPTAVSSKLVYVLSGPIKVMKPISDENGRAMTATGLSTHSLLLYDCGQDRTRLESSLNKFWDFEN